MHKTLLGYIPEDSPIYKLHPFVRLLFLLIVSFLPLLIPAPEWNFLILIIVLVLILYARVNIRVLRIYVPVAISMGMIILISYTLLGGYHPEYKVLFTLFGKPFYWERIRDALVVYVRILPMIATMVFFLTTSSERDIIAAMRSIKIPFVVTYTFAMGLRAAGMVLEDFSIIRQAEQARGFDISGKPLTYKIRKYVMYMIPLFAISLRRTEEFTNALVARGFSFTGEASKVKRADYILSCYQFHFYDGLIATLIITCFIIVVLLHYKFGYFSLEKSLINVWFGQH
jgi:energy-coupling factor transporter transmembrane protein EcfT